MSHAPNMQPTTQDRSEHPAGIEALALANCSALSAATKPEKINVRLFDLVRYMRSELHAANLISEEEYWWLCHECDLAKGGGSPSPRRLEDYDLMRRRLAALEKPNADAEPTPKPPARNP